MNALKDTADTVAEFLLLSFESKKFDISTKKDGSEVTNIDLDAQSMAKELLLSQFPNDGFLGEEDQEQTGSSEYRWVVDPIDGTASFIRGVPLFGTQIGLEYKGKPIAGKIIMPAIREGIFAHVGTGAYYTSGNSTETLARVSDTDSLHEAMISTTSIDYYKKTDSVSLFNNLVESGCSIRGWSDCYAFMLLCTGRIDGVLEPLLYPWDVVPWIPIIIESGGIFSPISSGYLASNPTIHAGLYDALHETVTN